MFPLILGLAALGAGAGALTSKEGGDDRWKRALIGGGLGALGGIGAGALMGGASSPLASATGVFNAGKSSALASSAGTKAGLMGALSNTSAMSSANPASTGIASKLLGSAKSQLGQKLTDQVTGSAVEGILGGGEDKMQYSQPMTIGSPSNYTIAPSYQVSSPLAGMSKEEQVRRYMMGISQ